MKVRAAFTFDDLALRTVRAAHGRGGKATRKECIVFIDRAVSEALKRAPDPKPARVKRPRASKPAGFTPPGSETSEEARAARERIRKLYRCAPPRVSGP